MNATIKATLGFYFTSFTPIYNNSLLLEKRKEKQGKERITPEFGRY
jgi:hypothetical protein